MKRRQQVVFAFVWLVGLGFGMRSGAQEITFDTYHSYGEITAYLKAVQSAHPQLARVMSMGKSTLGKDIWVIELTNRSVKKPEHKPAMYIDGGTHGNEVTGTEVCLHTIDYLVKNFGKDERVTNLLDTRTLYIAPSVNPDSNNLFVTTPARRLRNNQRPFDDDDDGLLDEDAEEDLDGDGVIAMMRKRDPEKGTMKVLPEDPRIMVRPDADKGEKGEYRVWMSEGLDNDKDGEINEDGPGGVNINRNYPAYWETADKQSRGGVYPLSEAESRAIVEFCLAHPNIATVQSYHTSGGFLYQPLAAEKPSVIPEEDRAVFQRMAAAYTKATGNEVRRPYREGGPRPGPYGFGIFIDWAYMHFGAYSGTTELWRLPEKYDPSKQKPSARPSSEVDASTRSVERAKAWFTFIDEELGGEGFVPWTPYEHPTLGEVEIGGWTKFIRANPPPKLLGTIVTKNTMADIAQAELTPLVVIDEVKVELIQGGRGARTAVWEEEKGTMNIERGGRIASRIVLLQITAVVRNTGPVQSMTRTMARTSLPHRPGPSDLLILEPGENTSLMAGSGRVRLGSLAARGERGDTKSASWLVQLTGGEGSLRIISDSAKGGWEERIIRLK